MALYQCVGRHFAAGGQLVKVGAKAEFDTRPGSLWQKLDEPEVASEKRLEVATPKKPAAKK